MYRTLLQVLRKCMLVTRILAFVSASVVSYELRKSKLGTLISGVPRIEHVENECWACGFWFASVMRSISAWERMIAGYMDQGFFRPTLDFESQNSAHGFRV